MIELKKEGIHVGFTIQVDTLCHKIPNFIEKATAAGVKRVFIGLENINPENLITAKKRQNKITEYRVMLQKWRSHGAITFAGYILGFPADTKELILRDIEIIKRELPLDILEFFFLTPLPGSEDHKKMLAKGVWMDPDINKYDLNHRVSHHSKMSDQEWEDAYRAAWNSFYTLDHIGTILKRAAAIKNGRPKQILSTMLWFKLMIDHEGVHPLEGGAFRLKYRRDRRAGLPIESPLRLLSALRIRDRQQGVEIRALLPEDAQSPRRPRSRRPTAGPTATSRSSRRASDEFEQLELYHATTGGEAALARKALGDSIRSAAQARRPRSRLNSAVVRRAARAIDVVPVKCDSRPR